MIAKCPELKIKIKIISDWMGKGQIKTEKNLILDTLEWNERTWKRKRNIQRERAALLWSNKTIVTRPLKASQERE